MEFLEYRPVLAELKAAFPDRNWLSLAQVAEYDGCCIRTVRKRYGIRPNIGGIDITVLARKKCELAH